MFHADLSRRVALATDELRWMPRAGIEERLLEDATASGRRTSIVRMAAGSQLEVPSGGCIDLLILDGAARIDRSVLGAGMYVHEPAGRALVAKSDCTVFLKQRPASRVSRRMLDTSGVVFEPGHTPGLSRAPLHADLDGDVVMLRFDPGTIIDHHHHERGEEFFVLRGEVADEFGSYRPHHWVRQPDGSAHTVRSPDGCLFFTFAHHL